MKNNNNLNNLLRMYRTSSKAYLSVPYCLNEIIIGVLLGDVSIQKPHHTSNVSLLFEQSIKNEVYIKHLYALFSEYCGTEPKIVTKSNLKSQPNKKYISIKFQTLYLPCFNTYWEQFYRFNGIKYKKVIPKNIRDLLSPISLAYWFMVDGGKLTKHRGPYLHTESVTLEENEILVKTLKDNFDLNCKIHKSISNKYKMYISSKSVSRFIDVVEPFMLSHFYYKLNI